MNIELSRRFARLLAIEPMLSLDPVEKLDMAHLVDRVNSFEDLSAYHQQLILEAEGTDGLSGARQQGNDSHAYHA